MDLLRFPKTSGVLGGHIEAYEPSEADLFGREEDRGAPCTEFCRCHAAQRTNNGPEAA